MEQNVVWRHVWRWPVVNVNSFPPQVMLLEAFLPETFLGLYFLLFSLLSH